MLKDKFEICWLGSFVLSECKVDKMFYIYIFFRLEAKKRMKNKKFGFGGKKKGLKANTKSSVNDTSSYRISRAKKVPGGSHAGKKNMGSKLKTKRLGKARRQKMKGRKK